MASSSSSSVLLGTTAILLIFLLSFAEPRPAVDSHAPNIQSSSTEGIGESSLPKTAIDCGAACRYRCSKASRTKICLRACGTCCQRCSCVPPGTYGNQYMCPCYAALTTHGGKRKCP